MKTLLVSLAALTAACFLTGCAGERDPNAPPPPPAQVYTVIHKDLDGTVTTDRATSFGFGDGGCVYYYNPDDQAKGIGQYRLFCGGTTHVKPEER